MTTARTRREAIVAVTLTALLMWGLIAHLRSAPAELHLGAVYPQRGALGAAATDEGLGIRVAVDLQNALGGVDGHRIALDARDVSTVDEAAPAIAALAAGGAPAVLGAYASDLSMVASAEAARHGLVYWEAGAVADRITERGLPGVFRVGATGGVLGSNSVRFAAEQLAPRLARPVTSLRVAIVRADDLYARSVADAADSQARALGMQVVGTSTYSLLDPTFAGAVADIAAERPDVLVLSSHVPDGVAFREAFLAAGLHVGALIGSTMAECGPDFGAMLGPDAVGVFASDRPGSGFDPAHLPGAARADYDRLAAAWAAERGGTAPTEEGLAGFSAAWALVHTVLPAAARSGGLTAAGIAAAARAVDLPTGSLPDGAGIHFSGSGDTLGQNQRSSAVVWQWQGVRRSVVVWPAVWATGSVQMVPLPR